MLDRYNITMGFYELSLFHLHTRGTGRLQDMKSWNVSQKSSFLHEYIHFLQDVTSIQGFNNFYILGEYIRYVTQKIMQSGTNEVRLPIHPFWANRNVDQNWLARAYTMGTVLPITYIMSYSQKYMLDLEDYNSGKRIPLNVVSLDCLDKKGCKVK